MEAQVVDLMLLKIITSKGACFTHPLLVPNYCVRYCAQVHVEHVHAVPIIESTCM